MLDTMNRPQKTLQQIYQLYRADKLVLHSMPTALIDNRPSNLANNTCLMSGSLLFFGGLQHQNGHHIPNAVARFGDDAQDTIFATMHDLDAVFATHEGLEKQKPEDKRGEAFVLFANSDIGNMTKREDQRPPKDYMDCVWGRCPPVQCERNKAFDFRAFCSTKNEKEDPSMEEEGAQWNEMRAVLNKENMVGLLYIHDPQYSPQQHEELAKKLSANFGDEYVMGVFKLRAAGHHQGDLLLVHEERQEQCMGDDLAEAPEGQAVDASSTACRLLTFQEYLEQQQQQQQQQQPGKECAHS